VRDPGGDLRPLRGSWPDADDRLVSLDLPGLDGLVEAAVVFAVEGIHGSTAAPRLRAVRLNGAAATLLGLSTAAVTDASTTATSAATTGPLTHGDEADRIVGVAVTGQPDSWVMHHEAGWFEQRAIPLGPLAGHPPTAHVLVALRPLQSLPPGGSDDEGRTRAALLLQISRRLGAAVGEQEVAEVVCDLVCPALGARSGSLAVLHEDESTVVMRRAGSSPLSPLVRRRPDAVGDASLLEVIRTGRQLLGPPPPESPLGADGALLTLPLRAGAATVGAFGLSLDGRPELTRARQEFLDTVAALVAQAMQRARLFDAQLEANLALQHALLPPTLPAVEGIDVAARYRPGSGNEVGGDWYDVVPLASGWTALVIGDVQGHDLAAAALMGQVRSVVRAYLLDQHPPTSVLASANAFLLSLGVDRLVTLCIVLVHPGSRMITVASAGHACPVQLHTGRPGQIVRIIPGPPLGVLDEVIWRERTTQLPEGSGLLLHTDGLIERRTRSYADGEHHLLTGMSRLASDDVERLADGVLELADVPAGRAPGRSAGRPIEDDTALLLMRWRPSTGPEPRYLRTLPVTPSSAVIARWYVEDLLASWGVETEVRETAVLLTDEVVANAVRHAHRHIRLDVGADDVRVRIEVFDDSHREPKLVQGPVTATAGRGLLLVDALAASWGVRSSEGDLGKTVWFIVDRASDAAPVAAPDPGPLDPDSLDPAPGRRRPG
jgi:serine phosphatase RsbU (regulator of sigma subunit)/anti-sigma regulatory factor (Ser/Thr protein kinase)